MLRSNRLNTIKVMLLSTMLWLAGCVTVAPEKPIVVTGAAGYQERMFLPKGARITIAIIDVKSPGTILAQKKFDVATSPVPFKFTLNKSAINDDAKYAVVAHITLNDKVLFQTYDIYEVINNNQFNVGVVMRKL